MQAVVHVVKPYQLHGLLYYQIGYLVDGEQQMREARLSHDMVYPDPQPGDRVEVRAILGIVDQISRVVE